MSFVYTSFLDSYLSNKSNSIVYQNYDEQND